MKKLLLTYCLLVAVLIYSNNIYSNNIEVVSASSSCEISVMEEELDIYIPSGESIIIVNIYTLNGTLVLSQTGNNSNHMTISLTGLNSDYYYVEVILNSGKCGTIIKF